MPKRWILAAPIMLLSGLAATPAHAQDAAETAVILSGSGKTTEAGSRSLGGAIGGAMGRASATINSNRRSSPRNRAGEVRQDAAIPADIDALEGTDAASYQMDNGARISVSGGLRPSARARCVENCAVTSIQGSEPATD
jgi:hypothetical protein